MPVVCRLVVVDTTNDDIAGTPWRAVK
jgi:hypothetical protein